MSPSDDSWPRIPEKTIKPPAHDEFWRVIELTLQRKMQAMLMAGVPLGVAGATASHLVIELEQQATADGSGEEDVAPEV